MKIFSYSDILCTLQSFYKDHKNGVLEILGPTASGKTQLSIDIAQRYSPSEILSVDSRQIYTPFDISAVKIKEKEMCGIPHWGLNLISPETPYSVADFQKYAFGIIEDIFIRNAHPILCGGTMLWLDAISENYEFSDKKNAEKSSRRNPPKWPFLKIGLHWDRAQLYERSDRRCIKLFQGGLIEEVESVLKLFPHMTRNARTNFGYQEIEKYILGHYSYEEALQENQKRNRNYIKRQLTWWRHRSDILWLDAKTIDNQ